MRGSARDYFFDQFDPRPSWRESPQTRPHRVTATGLMELPFGKGNPFSSNFGKVTNVTGTPPRFIHLQAIIRQQPVLSASQQAFGCTIRAIQ